MEFQSLWALQFLSPKPVVKWISRWLCLWSMSISTILLEWFASLSSRILCSLKPFVSLPASNSQCSLEVIYSWYRKSLCFFPKVGSQNCLTHSKNHVKGKRSPQSVFNDSHSQGHIVPSITTKLIAFTVYFSLHWALEFSDVDWSDCFLSLILFFIYWKYTWKNKSKDFGYNTWFTAAYN